MINRRLLTLALFVGIILPAIALAAPAEAPGLNLLGFTLTPEMIIGAAVTIVGGIFGGSSFLTVRRKRRIALGVYHAFHVVEDLANETEGDDIFDKARVALGELNKYLVANGWRPLKENEVELAKLKFQAIHGKQIADAKVLARANELTAEKLAEEIRADAKVAADVVPSP